jgi:hypothetical protein
MNENTKQGLKVLKAALLLGVLGDAMLRATPWGLNVLLWAGALAIALLVLLKRSRRRALFSEISWLLAPVILSASLLAWRDSLILNSLAIAAMLISLSLIAWRAELDANRAWLAGIGDYFSGMMWAGAKAIFVGFPFLVADVNWSEIPRAGWSRHTRAILRGVGLALPLLILFGLLFIAADAVFESFFSNVFSIKFDQAFGHILLALAFAWLGGGFLRVVLFKREAAQGGAPPALLPVPNASCEAGAGVASENNQVAIRKAPSLGIVEIGVALGLVNALFLSFVLVQIRYLFGGAALVQISSELTYAQYARRGFFELVTVAALVLPLLLIAHWLLRKESHAHERVFRLLAGTQVALLFIIMVSALRRMLLYQSEYGLTELRLYTTAFMGWLAIVFVWFILTVLRGRREHFSYGTLVAGLLAILTLHVINPDALIVRANVAHARAGRAFDVNYVSSLSADAAPALIESLPSLSRNDQCVIAGNVLDQWTEFEETDWRTWNRARSRARASVRENAAALQAITCPQPVNEAINNSPQVAHPTSEAQREPQQTETAFIRLADNKSLGVKRERKEALPAEYQRSLLLIIDAQVIAEHHLPPEIKGSSRVDVFKLSDSMYVLRDAYGTYNATATHMLVTEQKSTQGKVGGEFIGSFDVDKSKLWRFIPVLEQQRPPRAMRRKEKQKVVRSRR